MGLLDEIKDGRRCLILGVKHDLVVLVQPEEGEVCYADGFPVIRDLFAGAVDDMRHLIGHDELKILGRELVANEETVLYLYSTDHVIIHQLLLLLLLLLMG